MPLIAIHTGKKITPEIRSKIVAELGVLITVIPGKNAGNLMTIFNDGAEMAFNGSRSESCAYVDVKLHGSAEWEAKKKLIETSSAMFAAVLGIPVNDIYITVAEFKNWGALGQYL